MKVTSRVENIQKKIEFIENIVKEKGSIVTALEDEQNPIVKKGTQKALAT